jgi:hypothetical protein
MARAARAAAMEVGVGTINGAPALRYWLSQPIDRLLTDEPTSRWLCATEQTDVLTHDGLSAPIDKTILRILRSSTFSHSLGPGAAIHCDAAIRPGS